MTPEIKSALSTLLNRPSDPEALASVQSLLSAQDPSEDNLYLLIEQVGMHQEQGNWDNALALLELALPLVEDEDERAELLLTKARILEDELLEEEQALACFKEVLKIRPHDEGTAETVEEIELFRENWEKVAAKYVEEAESASDRKVATGLFLSAAEVAARAEPGSPMVEDNLRRALKVEPRNAKASFHLERMLRREDRLEDLADAMYQRADVAATKEERLEVFSGMGELYATELDAPDKAVASFKRVLTVDPKSERALSFLVETLTEQASWQELADVYADLLSTKPPAGLELEILVRVGELYEKELENSDKAEQFFRRLRKHDATHPALLAFYRRYFRDRGEAAKLLTLLDAAQRVEKDQDKRLVLAREMAEVAAKEVGNLEKAIDIWKGIQRMSPEDTDAAEALKDLYRASTPPKWNALRELLKAELEALPDDQVDEKILLLMEVVGIYRDHLKLDVMVINTYNAILDLQPDHAEALTALTEKYEAMGRWNDLIGLLLRRKEVQSEPEEQVGTLHRVADLWIEKFGNQSQAIKPLEEILELAPSDSRAMGRLREIHEKRRNWRELIKLSRREAEHSTGPRKRELVREVAELATKKLGDPGEGIQIWNQVLEDVPNDDEALDALIELYRKVQRWEALAEILHRQVENASSADRTLALLEELGGLYLDKLSAPDNAIDVWQRVLELEPGSDTARDTLRDLFVKAQRWESLEELFGRQDDYGRLAETLYMAADREKDEAIKITLYTRVGELQRDMLDSPEAATKAYERVISLDKTNVAVARALVPLYRDFQKWPRLLETHEVLLGQAEQDEDRLALLAEIRQICEQNLGSKAKAFEWCAKAFELDPGDPALRQELERLAEAANEWDQLVALYTDQVADLEDDELKTTLLRKLATLSEEQLSRPEDAEVFYSELLEIHPDDLEALTALERIFEANHRWLALVEVYNKRVELELDLPAKVGLLAKVASIQEEYIGDASSAVDALNALLELDPTNLEAVDFLASLYQANEQWKELVDILTRKLDLVDGDEERVDVLHMLGLSLQLQIEDHPRAIDYLAQVLSIDPEHASTVEALQLYLLEDGEERRRVAELLHPYYENSENWPRLVQVQEIMLEAEHDKGGRISLLRTLMQLHDEKLEQPSEAFDAGAELMRLDPEDVATRTEISRLAGALDREEELVGLYAEALEEVGETIPTLELDLNWEMAQVLDDRLGMAEEAEIHLRRVVELDPGKRDAYDTLERILRDQGKWEAMREVLEQRKELENEAEARRDILLQICSLNEDFLDDAPAAIKAYEEVLELEPDHGVALRALERHYTDAEMWQELLDLLRREMGYAEDDDQRGELKLRQADLMARHLDDPYGAVDLLEEVVSSDPSLDRAVDLLEELLDHEQLARRVSENLESVYERREEWDNLVRVLLGRRELLTDRFEAVELLCRAASLQEEKLAHPESAFVSYREALTLEPGTLKIHEAVDRLVNDLALWEEAAEAWSGAFQAAEVSDVHLRARLQARLARVLDEQLGDPERARAAYELLLELDPSDPETVRPAAEALARLYEVDGSWEALIGILRRQLGWEAEPDKREALLVKISRIQEEVLGEVDAAVETYQELLQENPESNEALDSLERLYLQTERWRDLVGIYRRRIDLATDQEERRDLWLRVASLYEEQLENVDQSIVAYLTVLDEVPDDLESVHALARIYRQEERWSDLLEMLERELSLGQADQRERVDLHFCVATLYHRNLDSVGVAIDRYQQVLEMDEAHSGTKDALEELLGDPDHKLAASELLAPMYSAESNWERLIAVYELQAGEAEPRQRVDLLVQVARLYEDGLDDLQRAFDAHRRVLKTATGEIDFLDHQEQFLRVSRTVGRWDDYVKVLEEVVLDVMDSEAQKVLYLSAAEVSRDHLDDLSRARGHYRSVLEADPIHGGALESLDALLELQEEWQPLLEIVQRRAELEDDSEARRDLLTRCAVLCRDQLDDLDDAILNFEQVLSLEPKDAQAIEALDELYIRADRWPDLSMLLERQLEDDEGEADRVLLYARLGQVRAAKLDEAAMALAAFHEVIKLEPDHPEALAALEGYLEDPDLRVEAAQILEPLYLNDLEWEKLSGIYRIRLDAADDPDRRVDYMVRIAQLQEDQLENLEQAFSWYGKVFLERPAHLQVRDQLLRLAGILENWEELTGVLSEYLTDTLSEDETSRDVAILLGGLYNDRLSQVSEAAACYSRALAANREDVEAFQLLETLFTGNERWEDLLHLYQDMAEAALDADTRRTLLLKICRVQEEALFNLPEAIEAYRAVLDLDENDEEGVQALDRLYTETERWEDLCELLNRRCDFAQGEEEVVALKYRVGAIQELEMTEREAAVDYYEQVLSRDPAHMDTITALERLVVEQDQRFRVAQILEGIYEATGDWSNLVSIYDAELEFIDDKDRRLFLLREIARLNETMGGSLEGAFDALVRALKEEFGDPELLENLERLADQLDKWGEVVHALTEGVDDSYDPELISRMQAKIATIQEEHLGDAEAAVDAWRKVLEAHEHDEQAVGALIRLLEQLEQHEALIAVLERKASHAMDLEEQKGTYLRVAEIYESLLDQPEKATETYRQMLMVDEMDWTAVTALERLYLSSEQWTELIWVYQHKLEREDDEDERRDLRLSIARVYEEQLEDNFEAISAYKVLQQAQPDDPEILDALDRLYASEQMSSDLLEVLEAKIGQEQDLDRRSELLARVAGIQEGDIGDLDGAINRYRQVIELEPTHAGAREALERLVRGDSHREMIAAILEQVYEVTGEVEPLVEVLELRLEGMADPPGRRGLLMRISQLREEGLDDLEGGFEACARALKEAPADLEVQTELDRLAVVLEDLPRLIAVYEERLQDIFDATLSRAMHLKVANLLEEVIGDDEGASVHYRSALDFEGDDLEPLRALDRILLRQEQWSDLLEVLDRELGAVTDPIEQADIYYRVGEIRLDVNGDMDGAFEAFRGSLEREPSMERALYAMERLLQEETYKVPVLEVLEPIYEADADHAKLVELLEIRLTTLSDPMDQTALLERIAMLYETELGEPILAFDALGRALAGDPSSEPVLQQLERLAEEGGRYEELVALADGVLLGGDLAPHAIRVLGLKAAAWNGEKLNDIERSQGCLKKVLEVDPDCRRALEELEKIFRASFEMKELCEVLWRRADHELDPDAKHELLREVAQINQEQLGDLDQAVKAWSAIQELAGDDREATENLVELYELMGVWEEYLDAQERMVGLSGVPLEQVAIKLAMGDVMASRLEDFPRAIEVYRDVLELDPQNEDALDHLEALYTAEEDWNAVQDILLRRLEVSEPGTQISIYFQLADLASLKMEAMDDAVSYYHQILELEASNLDAVLKLEAILTTAEKWYELVEVLRRHAGIMAAGGDVHGEVEQLVRAAGIWSRELENPDAAAELLEEILQRDEHNVQALGGLARIYETTEQWSRCQEVLQQALALEPELDEAAELEFRVGLVKLKQGGEAEEAAIHFTTALEFNPGHVEARDALEEHARSKGDWDQVAELLQVKVGQVEQEEQLALFKELGQIFGDKLDRPDDSVAALEAAQDLAPDDVEVLSPLADAYYGANRYDDAEPLLEQLLSGSGRGKRKDQARYTFRLGTIAEGRDDMDGAREHFDKAYRLDSTYGPTLVALGRIYLAQEDWSNVRRIYRSMLLQNIDENAGIAKEDIFYHLGLAHLELNENSKALSMFERGLEVAPDHEGIMNAMERAKG